MKLNEIKWNHGQFLNLNLSPTQITSDQSRSPSEQLQQNCLQLKILLPQNSEIFQHFESYSESYWHRATDQVQLQLIE